MIIYTTMKLFRFQYASHSSEIILVGIPMCSWMSNSNVSSDVSRTGTKFNFCYLALHYRMPIDGHQNIVQYEFSHGKKVAHIYFYNIIKTPYLLEVGFIGPRQKLNQYDYFKWSLGSLVFIVMCKAQKYEAIEVFEDWPDFGKTNLMSDYKLQFENNMKLGKYQQGN